eukprot:8279280-Alexandrium_andersonii.AAC.1
MCFAVLSSCPSLVPQCGWTHIVFRSLECRFQAAEGWEVDREEGDPLGVAEGGDAGDRASLAGVHGD